MTGQADLPGVVKTPLDPWSAIRRGWRLIAAVVLAGAVLGLLVQAVSSPSWTSSATVQILVTPNAGSGTPEDPARIVATQRDLVLADTVVGTVAHTQGLTRPAVRHRSTVTADTTADTLTIAATGSSAAAAQALDEALVTTYIAQGLTAGRASLQAMINGNATTLTTLADQSADPTATELTRSTAASELTALTASQTTLVSELAAYQAPAAVVVGASLPTAPSSLSRGKALGAGIALGLVVGLAVALLQATRGERLSQTDAIVAAAGVPLLAQFPYAASLRDAPNDLRLAIADPDDRDALAESARGLAVALMGGVSDPRSGVGIGAGGGLRIFLVTSPGRYDGKSLVAGQLAAAYARSGMRTTLVLADARSRVSIPEASRDAHGLTDLLSVDRFAATEAGFVGPLDGVRVVGLGTRSAAARDLLRGPELPSALNRLASTVDVVVVDAPAVTAPETVALAAAATGIVLVVGAHAARRSVIAETAAGLEALNGDLLGVVVVNTEDRIRSSNSDYDESDDDRYDSFLQAQGDSPETSPAPDPGPAAAPAADEADEAVDDEVPSSA